MAFLFCLNEREKSAQEAKLEFNARVHTFCVIKIHYKIINFP
jgi:hypothetical protein